MLGSMEGRNVAGLSGVRIGEVPASWGEAITDSQSHSSRPPAAWPLNRTNNDVAGQRDIAQRPSHCGHLVRQLKLFESLRFEQAGGASFYVTLLNCSGSRIGLDLEVPRIGRFLVGLTRLDRNRLRLEVCHGPERTLVTAEPKANNWLLINGADGQRFRMTISEPAPYTTGLDMEIPTLGKVFIALRASQDRARLQIVADRQIRIVPTARQRN